MFFTLLLYTDFIILLAAANLSHTMHIFFSFVFDFMLCSFIIQFFLYDYALKQQQLHRVIYNLTFLFFNPYFWTCGFPFFSNQAVNMYNFVSLINNHTYTHILTTEIC